MAPAGSFCPYLLREARLLTIFLHFEDTSVMMRLRVAVGLFGLMMMVALVGPMVEARQRTPEETARAYLSALSAGDLDAALATIEPSVREDLRERVAWQQGNRYDNVTVVLGRPSVLDRLMGRPLPSSWAVVTADVTMISGERWRSASTAGLVERDGVWYLLGPPFA